MSDGDRPEAVADELIAAYRATNYRVTEGPRTYVLRIGERSPDILDLLDRTGHRGAAFVTAYNPFSRPTSSELNEKAQQALLLELSAIDATWLAGQGEGTTGDWPPEPSVLALGLTLQQAEQIGRAFGQNAIVWIGSDGVPELFVLQNTSS